MCLGSDQAGLEGQLKTLREALDTIMEQKTRMENSFQADRKKYLVCLPALSALMNAIVTAIVWDQ